MTDDVPGDPKRSPLLLEIGKLILGDSAYSDGEWRSIALVYSFEAGGLSLDGYRYDADGPNAVLPEENGNPLTALVTELRAEMQAETGNPWHQMLYQIWMPGPDFRATFEYDNPNRWSLGSTDREGAASYAEQIDPARR